MQTESRWIKRTIPFFELLCFLAAWTLGIALAMGGREEPTPVPRERDVVVTDPYEAQDLPEPRVFRPIRRSDFQEGG